MGERGRDGGGKGTGRNPAEGDARFAEPADRPGASGHRFGPRLVCSECGLRWEAHQRDPRPCISVPPPDPFDRRPAS